jgi:hypothetical protein
MSSINVNHWIALAVLHNVVNCTRRIPVLAQLLLVILLLQMPSLRLRLRLPQCLMNCVHLRWWKHRAWQQTLVTTPPSLLLMSRDDVVQTAAPEKSRGCQYAWQSLSSSVHQRHIYKLGTWEDTLE